MMAKFTSIEDEATLGPLSLGSCLVPHPEPLVIPPCFPSTSPVFFSPFVRAILYYKRVAGAHQKCQRH